MTHNHVTIHYSLKNSMSNFAFIPFQEFADDPCLFAEGTTRFDVGQGSAGTCWFLSVLASLADKPDTINQVSSQLTASGKN